MRYPAWLAAPILFILPACTDPSAPNVRPVPGGVASATYDDDNLGAESEFSNGDVRFSFVVIGCNRVDKADTNMTTNPSTANRDALLRAYSEIAQMEPLPRFVFFAGDMVYGYSPTLADTVKLAQQLTSWMALYQGSPLAATDAELVPLEGNHEVQNSKKIAFAAAERTWLRVMAPYIPRAGNGPPAGGPDNLATDQSSLTYSFDFARTHFVLLNTDPVGKDASAPLNWVAQDLATAAANHVKHIFVIGHKPAYAYPTSLYVPPLATEDGLGATYPLERDALWGMFADAGVEAMLSAHNHLYYRTQGPVGATWQVVAGNGGSPIEPIVDRDSQSWFGYTVVTVHRNNEVTLTSYAHQVPAAGYLASSVGYPTVVRDQADISWPGRGGD